MSNITHSRYWWDNQIFTSFTVVRHYGAFFEKKIKIVFIHLIVSQIALKYLVLWLSLPLGYDLHQSTFKELELQSYFFCQLHIFMSYIPSSLFLKYMPM